MVEKKTKKEPKEKGPGVHELRHKVALEVINGLPSELDEKEQRKVVGRAYLILAGKIKE